ncbi:uncharacterized protein [Triticum aestivum]|uniref:uncharacterized protein n=1 Tax=Triticum aestivum TaxID=4565 RepID=UPI001D01BDD0|nr:uncharacterized protein LOC123047571 [Triticum aestivum]XP_044327092.1 uncharacterized protein LOC123047571 [Triticum aestivum]
MAGVVRLWNDWEVQILVLVSFMLQVFLLMFARMRRRNISIVPRTLLWLAYLLADSIAIYILGHMSFYGKSHGHQQLMAFWAPFLLVHLGGQDNITAYSMEDSKLWPRHLLSFVVQTVGVAYVLYKYVAGSWTLVTASALIFVSGILKYGERVWALKLSSLENMSKFLDGEKLSEAKRDRHALVGEWNISVQWGRGENLEPEEVLQGAHDLLPICMAQFVDYKFWPSASQSKAIKLFDNKGQMFELVEMQLSLMYDFLYTKAAVVFTWYGCLIRAISAVASITTFFLFQASVRKNDFNRVDAIVTYILIAGAVLLEMATLLKAMGSTWTCALLHARRWHRLHSIVIAVRRHVRAAERNRRWSGSIGHPMLLNSSHRSGGWVQSLGCKDLWKKLHHSLPIISDGTKKLVLQEVRRMVGKCEGREDIMRSYSGQCALNTWSGFFKDPTSHAGIDFDDKILSWYFATKIFFGWSSCVEEQGYVEAITAVSNYMIFLLVEHPYMLPSPVCPGLYASTEVAYVGLDFSDRERICKKLGLGKRKIMWNLDTRTDGEKLHRVRRRLDIIMEDLIVIRKGLDREEDDLGRRWDLDKSLELKIMRKELDKRGQELDDLMLQVGGRREKLEEPDRRSEVDGRREENLDLDPEEWNKIMEKLEELETRNKELHFGPSPPPPSLVRGTKLAVWLLEAEVRGEAEVRQVLLGVWVEMLCYAAHHCSRDSHARQLNSGGEFITVVWLLSTAMFNLRYCNDTWFKRGVREFSRQPFHPKEEEKKGWFHTSTFLIPWSGACCLAARGGGAGRGRGAAGATWGVGGDAVLCGPPLQ